MYLIAWITWVSLASVATVSTVVWLRKTHEAVAPLPICVATMAFYVLPRAGYLLWFRLPPLTSAGLASDQAVLLVTETTALALVALVAFLLGHQARSAGRSGATVSFQLPDPDLGRALAISAAFTVAGLAALALLLRAVGGVSYAIRHQYEVGALLEGKNILFQLTRLTIVPSALLLVDPVRKRVRWWVLLLGLASAVVLFPLGRRSFILLAVGYPVALYHLVVHRIAARFMLTGAFVMGICLFALSYVRLLSGRDLGTAVTVFRRDPSMAVHFAFNAAGELKIFDATSIIVRDVPNQIPFSYGETFVRVPWMMIPRNIWPAKPTTLGEVIVSNYLPQLKTGYPPMAIGELYAAGGTFAVILGFLGLGWISRAGWEWYRRRPRVGNASIYLAFCFFIFDFTRVGDPSRTAWFFILGFVFFTVAFSLASAPAAQDAPNAEYKKVGMD